MERAPPEQNVQQLRTRLHTPDFRTSKRHAGGDRNPPPSASGEIRAGVGEAPSPKFCLPTFPKRVPAPPCLQRPRRHRWAVKLMPMLLQKSEANSPKAAWPQKSSREGKGDDPPRAAPINKPHASVSLLQHRNLSKPLTLHDPSPPPPRSSQPKQPQLMRKMPRNCRNLPRALRETRRTPGSASPIPPSPLPPARLCQNAVDSRRSSRRR